MATSTASSSSFSKLFRSSESTSAVAAVNGTPRLLLRLEGAMVLLVASLVYARLGLGWGLFFALFLVPDVSMLGYLAGKKFGAVCYNAGHSYMGPGVLFAVALLGGLSVLMPIALIWTAHIGFDRMAGYGLKYGTAFHDTHLGRL